MMSSGDGHGAAPGNCRGLPHVKGDRRAGAVPGPRQAAAVLEAVLLDVLDEPPSPDEDPAEDEPVESDLVAEEPPSAPLLADESPSDEPTESLGRAGTPDEDPDRLSVL